MPGRMEEQQIVAVGLLTLADLDVLGTGFKRAFRVDDTAAFDDLLAQLDTLTATKPMEASRR